MNEEKNDLPPQEHMIQNPRLQQMRLLRRLRPAPHQRPTQRRRHRTHIPRHVARDFQRPGEHAARVRERLCEQRAEMRRVGREDTTGTDEIHGAGEADETGEKVGRAGFHGDAAAGEDEAVFGGVVGDSSGFVSSLYVDVGKRSIPYSSRKSHGHAHANSRALQSNNRRFAALVNRQGHTTTTVP